jgi:hypothetical protein
MKSANSPTRIGDVDNQHVQNLEKNGPMVGDMSTRWTCSADMCKKPTNLDTSIGDVGSNKSPSKSFLKHFQQGRVFVNRLSTMLFADHHTDSL